MARRGFQSGLLHSSNANELVSFPTCYLSPCPLRHSGSDQCTILPPFPPTLLHQTINLQVSNPFEASARNASDGRFTVSLKQAMVSEHPTVTNLNLPGLGRRASAAAVAAVRRRASSVLLSSVQSKSVASAAGAGTSGPPKTARDGGGAGAAGKKGRDGGGGGVGGGTGAAEDKMVRRPLPSKLTVTPWVGLRRLGHHPSSS